MTDEALAELDRKIAVMQASKTQEIQFREDHCGEWNDMKGESPSWDWEHYDYRVKPVEPRMVWVNVFGCGSGSAWNSEHEAALHCTRTSVTLPFIELTPEIRTRLNL